MSKNFLITTDMANKLCPYAGEIADQTAAFTYLTQKAAEGNLIHISTKECQYDLMRMAALKVNAKSENKVVVLLIRATAGQLNSLIAELTEMKKNGARFGDVYERALKPLPPKALSAAVNVIKTKAKA